MLEDLDVDLDGAALLDELHTLLTTYVVLPTPEAADAITLWIAATHALPAFQHAPRLAIKSREKRCGKSRLLDVISGTCHIPLMTANATVAAVFRSLSEEHPPTLLIDEADTLFGTKKAAENNEDFRALLNAGHQRGRPALRCVGPQQAVTEFPTFAMAALAGIGDLPDTITDRAINLTMRRRKPGETVASYRARQDTPRLHGLRDRLAVWVGGQREHLTDAQPDMPVQDRAADTWEPLVAIADAAGGDWPGRARAAALIMTGEAEPPTWNAPNRPGSSPMSRRCSTRWCRCRSCRPTSYSPGCKRCPTPRGRTTASPPPCSPPACASSTSGPAATPPAMLAATGEKTSTTPSPDICPPPRPNSSTPSEMALTCGFRLTGSPRLTGLPVRRALPRQTKGPGQSHF